VPDLVEHGVTGLLTPPQAPDRVAECVSWLLEHPQAAAQLGRQGQARVRTGFSPERMCSLLDELYTRLLGLPMPAETRADTRAEARVEAVPSPRDRADTVPADA
jgi:hypothetical protein